MDTKKYIKKEGSGQSRNKKGKCAQDKDVKNRCPITNSKKTKNTKKQQKNKKCN